MLVLVLVAADAPAQSLLERLVMPGDLSASHADLEKDCANCHESFRQGAQGELCLECHKPVRADVAAKTGFHGRSPEVSAATCSHCHTDHKGRDARIALLDADTFDHAMTDFALTGRHAHAACAACHNVGKPFRETAGGCVDCHQKDDRHLGALGKECADCHDTGAWAKVTGFDHSTTGFALEGAHATVACADCHTSEDYAAAPKECAGCHALDDIHAGRFGSACADCHVAGKWTEVRFDHDRDTKFVLSGGHRTAKCDGCHFENAKSHPPGKTCADCHIGNDVHRGALGPACATCHATASWVLDVRFDHDFTDFPLLGLHAVTACEACHFDASFQLPAAECDDCHGSEDKHRGTLGPACGDCHNPAGWDLWAFDHDKQSRFRLTGAHATTKCSGCHVRASDTQAVASGRCADCHVKDDRHKGAFGTNCARCHSTATFRGAKLR